MTAARDFRRSQPLLKGCSRIAPWNPPPSSSLAEEERLRSLLLRAAARDFRRSQPLLSCQEMRSVYADSATRTKPSRITRARLSPTPSTACRSVALAPKRAWSVPKCSISRSAR
jgi:hypothetical protein